MRNPGLLLAGFSLLTFGAVTMAEEKELNVGDTAPEFEVQDDSGKTWASKDHFGHRIVVVYFYPADMTGGCTKQACAFRDDLSALTDAGVEVVGVSGDSVRNHQLFRKAHHLNFPLLADVDGKVAEAFGVPITREEKSVKATIEGVEETLIRKVTAKRWTFVVGLDGRIAAKNTMVNAAEDAKAVAEVIARLKKGQ